MLKCVVAFQLILTFVKRERIPQKIVSDVYMQCATDHTTESNRKITVLTVIQDSFKIWSLSVPSQTGVYSRCEVLLEEINEKYSTDSDGLLYSSTLDTHGSRFTDC